MRNLLTFILLSAGLTAQVRDTVPAFDLHEVVIERDADAVTRFSLTSGAVTTEEVLGRLQSVQLIRRGAFGLDPSVRGMAAGQVSVTIDGMHMHGACTDRMDPVTIYTEPQNLYGIDVAAGGAGSAFGTAPGGAIDIRSAGAEYAAQRFSAGAGYQSAARAFHSHLTANVAGDDAALRLSAVYRKSGEYRDGAGTTVPFSYYEKANITASGSLRLAPEHSLGLQVLMDDGWDIGFPALTMDVGYAKARMYSGTYTYTGEEGTTVNARVYTNAVTHFMDDTRRPSVPMHMDMPGWSSTSGGYAEMNDAGAGRQLKWESYRTFVRAEMTMFPPSGPPMFMLTLPDAVRWNHALFASERFALSDASDLTVALRGEMVRTDMTSDFGRAQLSVFGRSADAPRTQWLPAVSATLERRLTDALLISLSAGVSERTASMNEAFGFYLYNRYDNHDYVGDPDLPNERSVHGDLTVSYGAPRTQWTASFFLHRFSNYIMGVLEPSFSAMTIGAAGVKVFTALPSATLGGGELSLWLSDGDAWEGIATAKYTAAADGGGEPLPLIPPLKGTVSVRHRMEWFTLQAEGEYAAPQRRVRTNDGERTTAGYFTAHVRGSAAVPLAGAEFTLNAGVENLFDTPFRDHLDWGTMLRPGRNLYCSIETVL